MTVGAGLKPTVRDYLASSTRQGHEALHKDPVLSKLTSPDLTADEYRAALAAFGAFYGAVERARRRLGLFERFSLRRECEALARDLDITNPPQGDMGLANEPQLLGALYVAHGASFGRNTFRANVMGVVKGQQHHFVSLRPAPELWQDLINRLESAGQSEEALAQMRAGAELAFSCMQGACLRSQSEG